MSTTYVAKIYRRNLKWRVRILQKTWRADILSHEIVLLGQKDFFVRANACRWLNKEMTKTMFNNKELEIIDG